MARNNLLQMSAVWDKIIISSSVWPDFSPTPCLYKYSTITNSTIRKSWMIGDRFGDIFVNLFSALMCCNCDNLKSSGKDFFSPFLLIPVILKDWVICLKSKNGGTELYHQPLCFLLVLPLVFICILTMYTFLLLFVQYGKFT